MIQRVEAGRELSQTALAQLGKSLPELIEQGVTSFVVDTSKVLEFDSATLEAILEFDALVRSRGLDVQFDRPSPVLYQALFITGLADRLDVRVDGMGSPSTGSASNGSAPKAAADAGKPSGGKSS